MEECACCCSQVNSSYKNTLVYDSSSCTNCGRCLEVCPHGVFVRGENRVEIAYPDSCMECGACRNNCPADAISVDSGVGCTTAMIIAALTRRDVSCGDSTCCGD